MKMKFNWALVLGLCLSSSAFAAEGQSFRLYSGSLSLSGKKISVDLRVDEAVQEQRLGDPEIAGHGFIRRSLDVRMLEGSTSCDRSILLENGEFKTCSGLRVRLSHPEALLSDKNVSGALQLTSSEESIGSLNLEFYATQAGIHEGSIDE